MICNSHRRENGGATCEECPLCAAETERAAIVAWLREDAKRFEGRQTIAADEHPDETTRETLLYAADAIERGDYRMGEP